VKRAERIACCVFPIFVVRDSIFVMSAATTWKDFENAKQQCLGKRDKSFAGRIDVQAVEICSVINERCEYYTTSSCSGRAFVYRGHGVKALQYYVGR
jgi:hypothetical protein